MGQAKLRRETPPLPRPAIRLVTEHPTFHRLSDKILQQVRDSRGQLTRQFLRVDPSLMSKTVNLEKLVDDASLKMQNRLAREYGIMGRYVAH